MRQSFFGSTDDGRQIISVMGVYHCGVTHSRIQYSRHNIKIKSPEAYKHAFEPPGEDENVDSTSIMANIHLEFTTN